MLWQSLFSSVALSADFSRHAAVSLARPTGKLRLGKSNNDYKESVGTMNEQNAVAPKSAAWRFKLGIAIICLIPSLWITVPLAAAADVPGSKIAALTGALFIINKILLLLVIAVMGKAGFQELKQHLFGYVSSLAPNAEVEVSPTRHRIGLAMFCLPLLSSFLEPYIDAVAPGLRPNSWALQMFGDVLLIGSFFVLGGNFWEKLRALFIRTARVTSADAI
jgi:hypothetical protein